MQGNPQFSGYTTRHFLKDLLDEKLKQALPSVWVRSSNNYLKLSFVCNVTVYT